MEKFTYNNPTDIRFGIGVLSELGKPSEAMVAERFLFMVWRVSRRVVYMPW